MTRGWVWVEFYFRSHSRLRCSRLPPLRPLLFSLAFATALLALASSEASAFLYSSFVCQAVGVRSVGWGRSFFIGEAKVIALSRCARRSGICTISYCVPGY